MGRRTVPPVTARERMGYHRGMRGSRARRVSMFVASVSVVAMACGGAPTRPTPIPEPPPPPPPTLVLTCPAAQTGMSLQNQPVAVSWPAPTAEGGTPPVTIACTPQSGATFTAGVAVVSCTAADAGVQRASCSFTVTITRPPQLSVTRFLAFGDSITWGTNSPPAPFFGAYPLPPPTTSYPTQLLGLLSARYLDQTITVVNEGWPGERVGDGLIRLPGVIASSAPEVLLLLDGANDLIGDPSSATTRYIADRLRDMLRSARSRAPGVRVLLANFPPQFPGTPSHRGAGAPFVPELNQRIAEVAASEGATLVDLYSALLPDLKQNIGVDGLHPTVQGFTLMAQTFSAAIQALFDVRTPAAGPSAPTPE